MLHVFERHTQIEPFYLDKLAQLGLDVGRRQVCKYCSCLLTASKGKRL